MVSSLFLLAAQACCGQGAGFPSALPVPDGHRADGEDVGPGARAPAWSRVVSRVVSRGPPAGPVTAPGYGVRRAPPPGPRRGPGSDAVCQGPPRGGERPAPGSPTAKVRSIRSSSSWPPALRTLRTSPGSSAEDKSPPLLTAALGADSTSPPVMGCGDPDAPGEGLRAGG